MSLPATDNFDSGAVNDPLNGRALDAGGGSWSAANMTIQAAQTSGGKAAAGNGHAIVNAGTGNVKVAAKIDNCASQFWELIFRSDSGFTQYLRARFSVGTGNAGVNVYDEASHEIGTGPTNLTIADTDAAEVVANGTSIALKVNGATVHSVTSSTYQTNLYAGIRGNSGSDYFDNVVIDNAVSQSAVITEQNLPSNHNGNIPVHVVGVGTNFTSSTTWTPSGPPTAGGNWTVASKTFVDATHYTVVLTPPAAATPPTGATGTLTLTEGVTGTVAATTTVGTPTLTISPTSGAKNTTPSLTLTGANTIWSSETPAGLITVTGGSGASIGTPTITTNTAGTVVLTDGSAVGTLTLTDTSTGATTSFTVTNTAIYLVIVGDSKHALNATYGYAYGTRALGTLVGDMLSKQRDQLTTVTLDNEAHGGAVIENFVPAYTGTYGTHTLGAYHDGVTTAINAKPAGTICVLLFAGLGTNNLFGGSQDFNDIKEMYDHMLSDWDALGKVDYFAIQHVPPPNMIDGTQAAKLAIVQGINAKLDLLDGTTTAGGKPVKVIDRLIYSYTLANLSELLNDGSPSGYVHPTNLGAEHWAEFAAAGIDRMLNPPPTGGSGGTILIL